MNSNKEVIYLNDIKEKKKILEKLNKKYIEVFAEKEELLNKEKISLEAKYLSLFGALLKKKIELNIDFRTLKYRLNLIMTYINKDEEVNEKEIEKTLKEKLNEYYKELRSFEYKMAYAKELMKSPLVTEEDLKEIKSIFRKLAKKLHPDLVGEQSGEEKLLWEKTLLAYENNDLLTLKIIVDIVLNELELKDDIHVKDIDKRIEQISEKINKLKQIIEDVQNDFPFDIREELNDPDFINEKKREIGDEIKELKEKIEVLNNKIESILEKEGKMKN